MPPMQQYCPLNYLRWYPRRYLARSLLRHEDCPTHTAAVRGSDASASAGGGCCYCSVPGPAPRRMPRLQMLRLCHSGRKMRRRRRCFGSSGGAAGPAPCAWPGAPWSKVEGTCCARKLQKWTDVPATKVVLVAPHFSIGPQRLFFFFHHHPSSQINRHTSYVPVSLLPWSGGRRPTLLVHV